jgi:hypothetical protein
MDSDATAAAQGSNHEPKVLRANQFILEDATGKTRAALDVGKDGVPGLYLYDETSTPRAMLGVTSYGAMLALCNTTGRTVASLAVSDDGASLRLSDDHGRPRLKVDVGKDGVPELTLFYANGVKIWSKP